ncbi:MAG: hypothetical protein MRZ79_23525 [Bacteroidia bacterium]|nr:hypothetical protein [Bacteroidia bacterium]
MQRFVGLLGAIMSVFFVGCGIAIMILQPDTTLLKDAPPIYHIFIGSLLAAYGGFRFWRSYKTLKDNKRY